MTRWTLYDNGDRGRGPVVTVITERDAKVRHLSRDEMRAELDALVADAGMTEGELRAAGAAWTLDAHHRGLLARVEGLRFLLDNTAA